MGEEDDIDECRESEEDPEEPWRARFEKRLSSDRGRIEKKWLLASLFILLSSYSFFGFLDFAPIGIFSQNPSQYKVNFLSNPLLSGGSMTVEVSSGWNGDRKEGLFFVEGGIAAWEVLLYSLIATVSTLGGFYCFRDTDSDYQVYNRIVSSFSGVTAYTISSIVMWLTPWLLNGDTKSNLYLFIPGCLFHVLSIYTILYQYSGSLFPDMDSINEQLYLQRQSSIAQGTLSIGLAVAIGGTLTYARQGTRLALPIALLVGVFLFPLAGVSVYRYYRIREAEIESRESINSPPRRECE